MRGKLLPIETASKAKRLHWGLIDSVITRAWYKSLRENNKTRKVYDVNPWVEVYQFREDLYGIFADNLDGMGDEWMYLINGPEKALLIDTAYGLGDIKGLCDEITGGKEIIVVNTHDHFDHAYGNCHFERVYCHEHLVPFLENQNPHMWDYIFDAEGKPIWVDFDRNELPEFKEYEIVGVPDGYTWDLGGGHEVELIFTGGHCAGHAMYLDKKNRILFSGDNLCTDTSSCGYIDHNRPGPYASDADMSLCRDRFQYLVDRMDEYDHVFPSHHMNDLDKCVIANSLDCLNEILAAPDKWDYKLEEHGKFRGMPNVTYYKYIKGFSAMRYTYDPEKLKGGENK